MKMKIIISLSLLSTFFYANAQQEIDLNNLEMPSSPAFILLDVNPTSIERPTTTKAFSTSVLNSINQNNGIPENYALEFAPYWFFKHKKINALNYWGIKKSIDENRSKGFSQARFGNISFATVKTSNLIDSIGTIQDLTNMSLGIRTTLIQVRSKNDLQKLIDLNQIHVERLSQINNDITATPEELIKKMQNDEVLSKNADKIKEVLNRKPVFSVDLAAAGAWAFLANDYGSININRMGAWLTLNYSKSLNKKDVIDKKNYINIYAIARVMQDNNTLDNNHNIVSSDVFDSGGKIEFELDRLSFSYEYLYRSNISINSSDSFRSSGLVKYRASEQLLVTGAFGRNFGTTNNLITQIGITWGFNSKNQGVKLGDS